MRDYIATERDLQEVEKLAYVFQAGMMAQRTMRPGMSESQQEDDLFQSFVGFMSGSLFSEEFYQKMLEDESLYMREMHRLFKDALVTHAMQVGMPEELAKALFRVDW